MQDPLKMVKDLKPVSGFKTWLTKSNALALAIGVVIEGAVGKVVTSIVGDLIMPLVSLIVPGSADWRAWAFGPDNRFKIGSFLGALLDFTIIAFVIFMITKIVLREAKKPDPVPTKPCPECLEQVPLAAKRCRSCTSAL